MNMLTKSDKLIIVLILILSILSYAVTLLGVSSEAPEAVVVTVNGKLYAYYDLADITSSQTVKINTEFGSNTLKITSDGAQMTDADCKDKFDIKCGKITKVGQIIVCAPNRVSVKLTGNSPEKIDKVTY